MNNQTIDCKFTRSIVIGASWLVSHTDVYLISFTSIKQFSSAIIYMMKTYHNDNVSEMKCFRLKL